jgi:hypothetical protein
MMLPSTPETRPAQVFTSKPPIPHNAGQPPHIGHVMLRVLVSIADILIGGKQIKPGLIHAEHRPSGASGMKQTCL